MVHIAAVAIDAENTSAFIRAAIEEALGPRSGIEEAEPKIAASLDGLTKTVLTCLPEPAGDAYQPAIARAKAR